MRLATSRTPHSATRAPSGVSAPARLNGEPCWYPATSASETSSSSSTAFSWREETPQARKVRNIGSRCSKARPIAELTMKSPTKNDSRPNAVRFR